MRGIPGFRGIYKNPIPLRLGKGGGAFRDQFLPERVFWAPRDFDEFPPVGVLGAEFPSLGLQGGLGIVGCFPEPFSLEGFDRGPQACGDFAEVPSSWLRVGSRELGDLVEFAP